MEICGISVSRRRAKFKSPVKRGDSSTGRGKRATRAQPLQSGKNYQSPGNLRRQNGRINMLQTFCHPVSRGSNSFFSIAGAARAGARLPLPVELSPPGLLSEARLRSQTVRQIPICLNVSPNYSNALRVIQLSSSCQDYSSSTSSESASSSSSSSSVSSSSSSSLSSATGAGIGRVIPPGMGRATGASPGLPAAAFTMI